MYIPKNQIQTDLYSNGNMVYKDTKEPYVGRFYKLSNGKYFTGKDQYDGSNRELISPPQQEPEPPEGEIDYQQQNPKTSTLDNYNYSILKGIDVDKVYKDITNIHPRPNESDYNIGVFTRYFVVKVNENLYYEVTKDTYTKVKNRDTQYKWELFIPFKLPWDIVGNKEDVFKTNFNIVELTERRLNKIGLQEFLNFNFTRYLKTED